MPQVPVMFLTCIWQTPRPELQNAGPTLTQGELDDLFALNNGWNVRSYWEACSLNLRQLDLKFHSLGTLDAVQNATDGRKDARDAIIQTALTQARAENIPVDTFANHVVYVHPFVNTCGSAGANLLLDEDALHAFYCHEFGHLLGLHHPIGAQSLQVYDDPYCLMGYTGLNSFSLRMDGTAAGQAHDAMLKRFRLPDIAPTGRAGPAILQRGPHACDRHNVPLLAGF